VSNLKKVGFIDHTDFFSMFGRSFLLFLRSASNSSRFFSTERKNPGFYSRFTNSFSSNSQQLVNIIGACVVLVVSVQNYKHVHRYRELSKELDDANRIIINVDQRIKDNEWIQEMIEKYQKAPNKSDFLMKELENVKKPVTPKLSKDRTTEADELDAIAKELSGTSNKMI
jgi:hypothetical protein